MNVPFVDLKAQYAALKPQMDSAIHSVLDRTAFIMGSELARFEAAFADYLGVKHVVGVSSGTDALHAALLACGVGRGDVVITAANTYFATCEAISHAGARFALVDVDPMTYNMNVDELEKLVSNWNDDNGRLKAILPVHLFGQPADMAGIGEIARRHGLRVVEDACQAHGARIMGDVAGGRRVGTFGDANCFSFYPGKNLGAYGDGGAVATDDDEIADKVRLLRNHGQREKYIHLIEGYCHRLDNLQAAVLGVKLPHLDDWNAARREHARVYNGLLADVREVVRPYQAPNVEPVYHLYVIQVSNRDAAHLALKEAGIDTGIHYPIPIHELPAYAHLRYRPEDYPVTRDLADRILSLPMYPELTAEQIRLVVEALKGAIAVGN